MMKSQSHFNPTEGYIIVESIFQKIFGGHASVSWVYNQAAQYVGLIVVVTQRRGKGLNLVC